jgi:eukaryotic-like serine/threonine-protein kinase
MKADGIFQFGKFQIDPWARTLRREEELVALSRRAFDVLLYLVQNPGRVVTRDELLKNVWAETFVDENSLEQSISALRRALEEKPRDNSYIVTLPGRGYQFVSPVEMVTPQLAEQATIVPEVASAPRDGSGPVFLQQNTIRTSVIREEKRQTSGAISQNRLLTVVAAVLVVAAMSATAIYRMRQLNRVSPSPMVVIADFQNATGDPSFDRVLDSAIEIDLKQSPYLTFLSQVREQETLAQMQRPKQAAITPEVAREVCQRNNAQVLLKGMVAKFGQKYLLTLEATDCNSGDSLAESKREAVKADDVPHAIDEVAADMRKRLGESRASVGQFGVPLFAENTGSLQALQRYSEAKHLALQGKYGEAISLFQRAIELDPKFAMSYADLATCYFNLGERELAATNMRKAYELRESVAEQDRLYIVAHYHDGVTGDVNEGIRNYQSWTSIYPRNAVPWNGLANIYTQVGKPELAIEPAKRALSIDAENDSTYVILALALLHDGQFEAAKAVCEEAVAKKLEGGDLHGLMMEIAFARNDANGLDAQIAWARSNPGGLRVRLNEALLAFARGQMHRGQADFLESSNSYKTQGLDRLSILVLRYSTRPLAETGYRQEARKLLDTLPPVAGMTDPVVTMAEVGEDAGAAAVLKQELTQHPADTLWINFRGPLIQAAILLAQHNPLAAIAALQPALPYDLRNFDVPFMRGVAYLEAHQPGAAELEFHKILDHPGVDPLSYEYPLARLGLARALAAEHKISESRAEYEKFLDLWKDADRDEPLLKQARLESQSLLSLEAHN